MIIDFKVGFVSLRRRYGGNIIMINKMCIVRFYFRIVKMFVIEILLKVFCVFVWLIFNYGIIVRRMIEIIFSVLENLMIKCFIWEIYFIVFLIYKIDIV